MLKSRIITALVLAPVVIAGVLYLPTWGFALLIGVFCAGAAYELGALAGLSGALAQAGYALAWCALAASVWWWPAYASAVLLAAVALWVVAMCAVVAYPKGEGLWRGPVVGVAGLVLVLAAWAALVEIHGRPNGPWWVLWVLVLCWAADIGAYFAGKAFGRHKLAPNVSPGKTWEGFAGGLLAVAVVNLGLLAATVGVSVWWVGLTVALFAISVFGDLFESLLKRVRGVKDSGALLPGHGGVLDRVDSILAVAPFFALV